MESELSAEQRLIKEYPYEIHQVLGPDGESVWIQKGINPDNIFSDRRRSDWPFSQTIADLICLKIAEGSSLTSICKREGFPPYSVVCRWRNENPTFKSFLEQAYKDRSEYHLEQVLKLAEELKTQNDIKALRLKIEALKWCVGIRSGSETAPKKKEPIFEITVRS